MTSEAETIEFTVDAATRTSLSEGLLSYYDSKSSTAAKSLDKDGKESTTRETRVAFDEGNEIVSVLDSVRGFALLVDLVAETTGNDNSETKESAYDAIVTGSDSER